jgi:peroxiredoxin
MKSLEEFNNWKPRYVDFLKDHGKTTNDLPELLQWLVDRFENTRLNLSKQSEKEILKWIKILPQTDAVICDEIQRNFNHLPKIKEPEQVQSINQNKLLELKAKALKFKSK